MTPKEKIGVAVEHFFSDRCSCMCLLWVIGVCMFFFGGPLIVFAPCVCCCAASCYYQKEWWGMKVPDDQKPHGGRPQAESETTAGLEATANGDGEVAGAPVGMARSSASADGAPMITTASSL